MSYPCIAPEEFGAVSSWPEDSPARRHLENCPRCLAQYRDYLAFLDHDAPAGARPEAAGAVLSRLIDREFGTADPAPSGGEEQGAIAGAPSVGVNDAPEPARPRSWTSSGRRWLSLVRRRPRLAYSLLPVLGLVAVAVVLVARTTTEAPPVAVLRGSTIPSALQLRPPEKQPNEGVRLSWSAVSGADAYRVVISGTDLRTLCDTTVATNSVVIRRPDRGVRGQGSSRFLWTVTAMHDRSVMLVSTVGSFLSE